MTGSNKTPLTLRLKAIHDETHDVATTADSALVALAEEVAGLWLAVEAIAEAMDDLTDRLGS
jgi:hypothetical protein